MVHSYLSYIPTERCKPLPDDVWMDILSRLPAEDLIRCQLICRYWSFLISTPDFNDLYLNHGPAPILVFQEVSFKKVPKNVLFLGEWDEKHKKITSNKKVLVKSKLWGANKYYYNCPKLEFSHHGLLFFKHENKCDRQLSSYSIVNPVTLEQHTFDIPCGKICTFFSHPVTKEYYLLWVRGWRVIEFNMLRFDLLVSNNLNSDTGWKVCNKLTMKLCNRSNMNYLAFPSNIRGSHIIKKDAIYWMNECFYYGNSHICQLSIIIFDIKNEEFDVISHPRGICNIQILQRGYRQIHLFEMEGHVSLCKFSISSDGKTSMDTWILRDDPYTWSRGQTIILDMTHVMHSYGYPGDVKPIGILNGELIIRWGLSKLFAYHLQQRTMRKVIEWDWKYSYVTNMCIHRNTILSLKNYSKFQNHRCCTPRLTCLLSKLKKHLL